MKKCIISLENLVKVYGAGETEIKALDDVNLDINEGEFIAITGESGSGKSTLLNMIGGLDNLTSGKILVDGEDISKLNDNEISIYRRRKTGFIFQYYNLIPILNAEENITMTLDLDAKKVDMNFFKEIVSAFKLENKLKAYPSQLSGGQQQRVSIARAMITKPLIILADEPTGNLDTKNGENIFDLLQTAAHKYNQTLVVVTHNEQIAMKSQRRICLEDGKIKEIVTGGMYNAEVNKAIV